MATNLFENIIEFPDPGSQKRFANLVGLDSTKERLTKEARLLLNPTLLDEWSEKFYDKKIKLTKLFKERGSLFIFAGDVGTGKTTLAETFGDEIARVEKVPVILYRLSLKTRGNGNVGNMTQSLSDAFEEILKVGKQAAGSQGKKPKAAIVLVIDEADSLVQSRELEQMHHEDRVGVNAVIRGIDTISADHLPVLVVMCTNRLSSIDPAIARRAVSIFTFVRPNESQRHHILKESLQDTEINEAQLNLLVKNTGKIKGRTYGYTYSDIMQRLVPDILLESFPDTAIDFKRAALLAEEIKPTPPFKNSK